MKTEPTLHVNQFPQPPAFTNNCRTAVYGYELEAGDLLEEDDMYESASGFWIKCVCPGLVLQPGFPVKWVRPCR